LFGENLFQEVLLPVPVANFQKQMRKLIARHPSCVVTLPVPECVKELFPTKFFFNLYYKKNNKFMMEYLEISKQGEKKAFTKPKARDYQY